MADLCQPVILSNCVDCGGNTDPFIYYTWPMTVQFTDTSQNTAGATYSWDFGDNGTSSSANPQHVYSTGGVFTVTLTLTSSNGTSTSTRTGYVNAGCVVPNFANTSTTSSDSTWTNAHFTTGIFYWKSTGGGGSWTQNQNQAGSYTIGWQSQPGGKFYSSTQCGVHVGVAQTAVVTPVP